MSGLVAPLAIAHRAGNDLGSLRAATALGVDVVEADVHDHRGRLEVRHLKTAGRLPVLWDAWQLRPGWHPRLLLPDLLAAADAGTTFMLDVKGDRPEAGLAVARLLHEHGPSQPVLVCGRYWPALSAFAEVPWARVVLSARTRAELALLVRRVSDGPAPYGVSLHRSLLTAALCRQLRERVDVVMTWAVNDSATLTTVLALGANGIISDELAVLAELAAGRSSLAGAAPPGEPRRPIGQRRLRSRYQGLA